MIAYVSRGALEVGDRVALHLVKVRPWPGKDELVSVVQVSTVTRVGPSEWHMSEPMDEVEF